MLKDPEDAANKIRERGNALPECRAEIKKRPVQLSLVMTVIGRDKPGLVDSLAGIVADHGGNWLENRMWRLGGPVAGILRVPVPAQKAAAVGCALNKPG